MEMKGEQHLPLREYFSFLSYLTLLLITSFIFLPHSTSWLVNTPIANAQHSSADRPEHPLLTIYTSNPLITMIWDIVGIWVIMIWWGQHMSVWYQGPKLRLMLNDMVDEKEILKRQTGLQSIIHVSLTWISGQMVWEC